MNETKAEILRCLSGGRWCTTPEVAHSCDLGLTNCSELLRRYRSQGLVTRERNPAVPRGYLYRITETGIERLHYLSAPVVLTSAAIAGNIGLSGKKKQIFDNWVKQKLGGK